MFCYNGFDKVIVSIVINKNLVLSPILKDSINLNIKEVFKLIETSLLKSNYIRTNNDLIDSLQKRESLTSTGIGDGIAIPHGVVKTLKTPRVVVIRLKGEGINWEGTLDDKKVNLIISILVPEGKRDDHFEILTKISKSLVSQENINLVRKGKPEEVVKTINSALKDKKVVKDDLKSEKTSNKDSLKIVGVTTCPTGIAHTFMAAEALETYAKKMGYSIKVEKQAAIGVKDELTEQEILEADFVIFGAGKEIEDKDRFEGKVGVELPIGVVIRETERIFKEMIADPVLIRTSNSSRKQDSNIKTKKNLKKKDFSSKISDSGMRHLLSGVSYMLPFVVVGGIFIALAIGIGAFWPDPQLFSTSSELSDYLITQGVDAALIAEITMEFNSGNFEEVIKLLNFNEISSPSNGAWGITGEVGNQAIISNSGMTWKHNFWRAMEGVGAAGFTLMIPVLAMYTAKSIAGRAAMAPAAIVALFANGNGNSFFNYDSMQFGNFENSVALGFFGSIAAGYLIGYMVKFFNDNLYDKIPQVLAGTIPIIVLPIGMSFLGWVFFAFAGYVPLYYIQYGLNLGVEGLINVNMLWIVGFLLGAMIAFDMGGPINKIAFLIGTLSVSGQLGDARIMAMVASAIVVPNFVAFFTVWLAKLFKVKTIDSEDRVNGTSAGIMGIIGITEGAIPFAVKFPKYMIPTFVLSGAIAGLLTSFTNLGNAAPHGGLIVYFVGAIGNMGVETNGFTPVLTNYGVGMFYVLIVIGSSLLGAFGATFWMKFDEKRVLRKQILTSSEISSDGGKIKKAKALSKNNSKVKIQKSFQVKKTYNNFFEHYPN